MNAAAAVSTAVAVVLVLYLLHGIIATLPGLAP